MTFKSLINFGNLGKAPWETPIERYHSDGGGHHHGYRGNSKGKSGSTAALSALTLLAFLFFLNVMQQSLQENNSTLPTTTAVLLRDTDLPIVLDSGEEKKMKDDFVQIRTMHDSKTTTKNYMQREV